MSFIHTHPFTFYSLLLHLLQYEYRPFIPSRQPQTRRQISHLQPSLYLIVKESERHGVRYAEGEKPKVKTRVVELEIDAWRGREGGREMLAVVTLPRLIVRKREKNQETSVRS